MCFTYGTWGNLLSIDGEFKNSLGVRIPSAIVDIITIPSPRSTTSSPVIMIPNWADSSMPTPMQAPARASWAITCLPTV